MIAASPHTAEAKRGNTFGELITEAIENEVSLRNGRIDLGSQDELQVILDYVGFKYDAYLSAQLREWCRMRREILQEAVTPNGVHMRGVKLRVEYGPKGRIDVSLV